MKFSTATPYYKQNVIENYGKEICSRTLQIQGGLSYYGHNESVFENLQMSGGDIVVNDGSTNISGKLTGTIHNMSASCGSSFYINEYAATRTGNYFTAGGAIYTSDAHHRKIIQDVTNLTQEEALLKKLEKSTRVTPEKAYERYLLIKQGKENQLYSMQTVLKIKREHPENWREVMAMDAWGLKGGGNVVAAVVTAGVGYALDRAFNHHGHHRANVHAKIGVDHRGNIAGGFNRQSVNWQLGNRRRNQDQHSNQITETFNKDPYVQLPRKNKNHVYWKELEALPRKVKLQKELQTLFKPESQYSHSAHNYRSSPELQIYDARHMKIDTTEYLVNRDNFHRLYQSLKHENISHQDILMMVGNPYAETIRRWKYIPEARRQIIRKEYPEMDVATAAYLNWEAEHVRISNIKEGVDDVSLDFAMFATGVKGIVSTATTAWKLFFSRKITQTAVKNATKIEKIAYNLTEAERKGFRGIRGKLGAPN